MRLVVEMPWEKDLSKNHNRMGPQGNWNYKSHVAAWMDRLGWEVKLAAVRNRHKKGNHWIINLPLRIQVSFRYPSNRKTDDHNFYETICDALKGVLGVDDDQMRISTGTIEVDRANPGFTITVEDSE